MDCCICSPMATVFRPPRNTICAACYEGGHAMLRRLNDLEDHHMTTSEAVAAATSTAAAKLQTAAAWRMNPTAAATNSSTPAPKGLSAAFGRMKEMEAAEEATKERLGFLEGFVAAFKEEIHADILLIPQDDGSGGPPIPAHRALLAARSPIFRTLLCSDECKAGGEGSVGIPGMSREELRCFVEFLYTGSLPEEASARHGRSLLVAADKFDVPYLRGLCERRMAETLGPATALEVLEVSDRCSSRGLRERALGSIVDNAGDVVFSAAFEGFARDNPHLCVEITRALILAAKVIRNS